MLCVVAFFFLIIIISLANYLNGSGFNIFKAIPLIKFEPMKPEDVSVAFTNISYAILISIILNIISVVLGLVASRYVDVVKFKAIFGKGTMISLLLSGISITGYSVSALDLKLAGLRIYSLLTITIALAYFVAGFLKARMKERKQIIEGIGIARAFSKPSAQAYHLFFLIIIFQSLLPTLILLVPFVIATGQILDFGMVLTTGILYLWGPASLYLFMVIVFNDGWLPLVIVANILTTAITFAGYYMGVNYAISGVIPDFTPYLMIVSLLVMWVGYSVKLGVSSTEIDKITSNILTKQEEATKILKNFVDKLLFRWLYAFVGPAIAPAFSTLHFSSATIGTLMGLITTFLLIVFFYFFPNLWESIWRSIEER